MTPKQSLPAWVKRDGFVRLKANGNVGRITELWDGGFAAEGAWGKTWKVDHSFFEPASIEDRIRYMLIQACHYKPEAIRSIMPDGADDRRYRITFDAHVDVKKISLMQEQFEVVELAYDAPKGKLKPAVKQPETENAVLVTIYPSWLDEQPQLDPVTPEVAAQAMLDSADALENARQNLASAPAAEPPQAEAVSVPESIRAKIIERLQKAGCDSAGVVISKGESNSDYDAVFLELRQIPVSPSVIQREGGFIQVEQNKTRLSITIPSSWEVAAAHAATLAAGEALDADLNPIPAQVEDDDVPVLKLMPDGTLKEMSDEDLDAEIAADEARKVLDPELQETARLINELKDRVTEKDGWIEALEARIQSLVQEVRDRDEHIERIDARNESLLADLDARDKLAEEVELSTSSGQLAVQQREWDWELDASRADMNRRDKEGWQMVHIQWDNDRLRIVYVRDCGPMPKPLQPAARAAKLIEPVGPSISYQIPQPPATAPINFGEIATARATLTAMADDPEVSVYDFNRQVNASRLPWDEKDALILRRRQLVGQEIAAKRPSARQYPPPSPFSLPRGAQS